MNKPSPERALRTDRLLLRPFEVTDAARLAELAAARAIVDTMISIPYPLSVHNARREIVRFEEEWESGAAATFAITLREHPEQCVGSVAIRHIDREHEEGELSFWIAEAEQGNGYATEAAGAVVEYAFRELGLIAYAPITWCATSHQGTCSRRSGCRKRGACDNESGNGESTRMCYCGPSCARTDR